MAPRDGIRPNLIARRSVLGALAATIPALDTVAQDTSERQLSPFQMGWLRDQIVDTTVPIFDVGKVKAGADIDLRSRFPEPFQQGRIQSCVANAVASLVQYVRARAGQTPAFVPSRMFFYYYGRYLSQARDPSNFSVYADAGMSYVDALTTIRSFGICPEALWPYDDSPPSDSGMFPVGAKAATQPSDEAYVAARKHIALGAGTAMLKQDFATLHSSLVHKTPFLLGFDVYPSFYDGAGRPHTNIPIPSEEERKAGAMNGHGVLLVGYRMADKVFICRNSWGTGHQDKGYFYLPVDYVLDPDLIGAIWTISEVLGFA